MVSGGTVKNVLFSLFNCVAETIGHTVRDQNFDFSSKSQLRFESRWTGSEIAKCELAHNQYIIKHGIDKQNQGAVSKVQH